jgi:hypothetical protein
MLNKIFDFYLQTFQNTKHVTINYIDCHPLLKLKLVLKLLPFLVSSSLAGDVVLGLYSMLC